MPFIKVLALAALPLLLFAAGDAAVDRATLAGLKAVNVVIDPIHPELEQQGVRRDELLTQVREALQNTGIAIDDNATEFLGVRILAARQKKGPYSMSVAVGLYQPVQLVRDPKIKTATQTWEVGSLFIVEPKMLPKSPASVVRQLAEAFVAAHQSVRAAAASAR